MVEPGILEFSLLHFMSYEALQLQLPVPGLVLVTGPNGSGKSSLIEAVSFALFGKTLRGTSPWSAEAGAASVATPDVEAHRTRHRLSWSLGHGRDNTDEQGWNADTITKAQELLEAVIGSWDSWRRTRVFSSADAALFSQATDSERKRLLETILGLHRFDEALAACRSDLRKAEDLREATIRDAQNCESALSASKARLRDARAAQDALPPEVDLTDVRAKAQRLEKVAREARAELTMLRESRQHLDREMGRKEAQQSAVRQRQERIQQGDCPECGQAWPPELLAAAETSLELLEQELKVLREAGRRQAAQDRELTEELEEMMRQCSTWNAKLREAGELLPARQAAQLAIQRAEEEIVEKETQLAGLHTDMPKREHEAQLLYAVEQVLGIRGVRAHVLGKALSGVEAVANQWLSKLDVPMHVALKPHTEKKSGGVSDAISLEVGVHAGLSDVTSRLGGVPAKHGYRAASSGQRRRIDIALLLALSEVSAAASPSPLNCALFLDEVFDALDEDGAPAVARCLEELAKDKLVMVITHVGSLKDVLSPTVHLHVEDGAIRKVG